MYNLPFYPFLSVRFCGFKCVHLVVQPSSPSHSRAFSSSQTKPLFPLSDVFPVPLPRPWTTTILLSASMDSDTLGSLTGGKINLFLWPACFTQPNVLKVHPSCKVCEPLSFLRLSNTLLYARTTLWVSTSRWLCSTQEPHCECPPATASALRENHTVSVHRPLTLLYARTALWVSTIHWLL